MKAVSSRICAPRVLAFHILLAIVFLTFDLQALTILPTPTLTKAANAPLAGLLVLSTDTATRLNVSMVDGTNTWERNFPDFTLSHSVPLLGFKPNRTNIVTVTVEDRNGNTATAAPLTFITGPLPADFPPIRLLQSKPEKMEPGYTLFRGQNNSNNKGYLTIVDNAAEVVWYSGVNSSIDVQQLSNGNLWIPLLNSIVEINMLGQTVKTWTLPSGKPYNHESFLTDHGTILYLSDATRIVTNFPTSSINPTAPRRTTNVWHQPVIELSTTNAAILNTWQPIDMLDPTRINYLTFSITSAYGKDWMHANAIEEDPRDDSLIVSMRHQDAVIKFSRTTGQLKWILGTHANWGPEFQKYLLTPVGQSFEWQYGQHTPKLTPQGTLLLFDDGNFRASPFDTALPDTSNYSRAVEYRIDEEKMEVSQVWQYGAPPAPSIYSVSRGSTQWLSEKENVLISYPDTAYVDGHPPSLVATNARMVRIQEVTHEATPEIVFDMALFDYNITNSASKGYSAYRAARIRDLYPARAVKDLQVTFNDQQAVLRFSGDDTRLYIIQTSTDLKNWTDVGTANPDGSGIFSFEDQPVEDAGSRYYRVITK